MFTIDSDNNISVTRGDVIYFGVSAEDPETKELYMFQPGDVVRINVYGKNDCTDVVLKRDFLVYVPSEEVEIFLGKSETKIGDIINKPKDYWYEVVLNPDDKPQTIIGYGDDGAKVFKLLPEGEDDTEQDEDIQPEDIPIIDDELDEESERPVKNKAIAKAIVALLAKIDSLEREISSLKADESTNTTNETEGE